MTYGAEIRSNQNIITIDENYSNYVFVGRKSLIRWDGLVGQQMLFGNGVGSFPVTQGHLYYVDFVSVFTPIAFVKLPETTLAPANSTYSDQFGNTATLFRNRGGVFSKSVGFLDFQNIGNNTWRFWYCGPLNADSSGTFVYAFARPTGNPTGYGMACYAPDGRLIFDGTKRTLNIKRLYTADTISFTNGQGRINDSVLRFNIGSPEFFPAFLAPTVSIFTGFGKNFGSDTALSNFIVMTCHSVARDRNDGILRMFTGQYPICMTNGSYAAGKNMSSLIKYSGVDFNMRRIYAVDQAFDSGGGFPDSVRIPVFFIDPTEYDTFA